jgi:hypothetical protein
MGGSLQVPPRKTRRALARAELLRLSGWGAVALLASALAVLWLFDSDRGPNCASLSIREQPRAELAREPGASVFELAEETHRTETWRLGGPADALQGRLRVNEIGSIYAWVAGRDHKLSPAVLFLDRSGEVAFVVAPGNVFEQPLDALPQEFAATVHLMRQLKTACASTAP